MENKNLIYQGEQFFLDGNIQKAIDCFAESNKNIFDIVSLLSEANRDTICKSCINEKVWRNDKFFLAITESDIENRNRYLNIYIMSVLLILKLQIKSTDTPIAAHYTSTNVLQKLLNGSPFRLNNIKTTNDPRGEGKTLLDYIYGKKIVLQSQNYEAFVGCFTYNHDDPNMFNSSYGDSNAGVSIVVKNDFFNRGTKLITQQSKLLTLYRCIYIDCKTGNIELGQGDGENKRIINRMAQKVKHKLEKIKKNLHGLNEQVVALSLLNLRYLVKDISFKQENECRIVKIKPANMPFIKYEYILPHVDKIILAPCADEKTIKPLLDAKSIHSERSKNPYRQKP